jgi:hypothetical protein
MILKILTRQDIHGNRRDKSAETGKFVGFETAGVN